MLDTKIDPVCENLVVVGVVDVVVCIKDAKLDDITVEIVVLEVRIVVGVVKVIDAVKVGKDVDVDNVTKDGKTFKLVDDVNIKVAAVKELEFNLPNTIDDKDMMLVLVLGEF
ncbi:hypothetical protein HK100_010799 [Physocladia obscura]|uniref:Uncharacterized protein n=1 Tax=Physocladia obscura TaxID=109957 RepID=A0AAD5T8T6_9FUNG|nr:hypothetical protein HK100_010799 [Physocladia obscura]